VKVSLSELPPGYVWQGRYVIVKALEKGSGGSVYLVNDISMAQCESHLLKEKMVQHKSPLNEFIPSN
jgi:ribosomal protein L7Ae-like RNA K-turn-binding protein